MRKTALLLILVMLVGCMGTLKVAPPAGCEGSALYKVGFNPLGAVVIRMACYDLGVLREGSRPGILKACELSRGAVEQGKLLESLRYLSVALVGLSKGDKTAQILVFNALTTLDAVLLYKGVEDLSLDDCDQNVLLSLINNIEADIRNLETYGKIASTN